jgi:cellulose biosynthesis protein BcsQ
MKTVAVYNNKGGVGKTTIAVHLALHAEASRIKTMAVGMDRQGDLMRWISGGDQNIREGELHEHSAQLKALYSPDVFPRGLQQNDLVIVDCPPAIEVATKATADLFVVPVDGRLALQDLMNVLQALLAAGNILIVFNRADAGGKTTLEAVQKAAQKIPQQRLTVWDEIIPDSAAIKRSAEYFKPAWDVPYGAGTSGPEALRRLCGGIISQVGVTAGRAAAPVAPRGRR